MTFWEKEVLCDEI